MDTKIFTGDGTSCWQLSLKWYRKKSSLYFIYNFSLSLRLFLKNFLITMYLAIPLLGIYSKDILLELQREGKREKTRLIPFLSTKKKQLKYPSLRDWF